MPNVTFFASPRHFEDAKAQCDAFIAGCAAACRQILQAEDDKIHIIFVPVLDHFMGRDAYIEIKLRSSALRSEEIMKEYTSAIDALSMNVFGINPRIRCFSYEADKISALN